MADVAQLLDEELLRGAPGLALFQPGTILPVEELLDAMPGISWSRKVRELAELEGGPSRSSAAYKNARRRIERQVPSPARKARGAKASSPSKASKRRNLKTQLRLRTRELEASEFIAELRLHGAKMAIEGYYSATDRPHRFPPHGWVHISQRQMRHVLRLWAAGDRGTAADVLMGEFAEQYALAMEPELVERLELRVADGIEEWGELPRLKASLR